MIHHQHRLFITLFVLIGTTMLSVQAASEAQPELVADSAQILANQDTTNPAPLTPKHHGGATSERAPSSVTPEMNFAEGERVDERYRLPRVNASVAPSSRAVEDDGSTVALGQRQVKANLARVLNFYNTERLAANLPRVQQVIGDGACATDLEGYVQGLQAGEQWALKMDDASGRYSTGWFWGNHYWTGSPKLCENIAPRDATYSTATNRSRTQRDADATLPKPTDFSPSQSKNYVAGKLTYSSVPFAISFYMLRININFTFTTEERTIHVGLCLPRTCSNREVQVVMEETVKSSPNLTVRVEAVRSQNENFDLWQDFTFRVLCVVTILVGLLLFVGTVFDLYLHSNEKRHKRRSENCATFKNSKIGDKTITLDMAMPESIIKNGKCNLYVVNNNNNNNLPVPEVMQMDQRSSDEENLIWSICKDLVLAFSVRVNIKHICDQSVGSDTLPVLHGLKSISMAWVILGHTCIIAFKYSDNMEYRKVVQKEFLFQTISNGAFSVDTFFFASGLLVSFLYFRSNAKGKLDTFGHGLGSGVLHFLGLILYRFARLSAPYLYVLGFVEVVMKWFNYNSIFEPPTMDHENCPKYWWRNILYINTLFPVEQMCMLWSWYLSDDTQFYVVGAVMLILATSHFKSAASLLLTFMFSSWITTGYIAYSNKHMPNSDDPLALFDKIYDKPYTRLGPYLIGMSVGWILFKTNRRIRMSKMTVSIGWITSSACLLSLVYGLYEVDLTPFVGAAYSSLSHSAWALGLAWIVLACSTGHGGYINSILSATILYPFSRVTYCAYLVHPIVIRIMAMNMDSPLHLGKEIMVIIFLGQVVASYTLGFVISVAFEAPVVSMLRILSRVTPKKSDSLAT